MFWVFFASLHFLPAQAELVVVGVLWEHVEVDVVGLLDEQRLEVLYEGAKAGALVRILVPAVVHDVVDLTLAVLRFLQAVAVAYPFQHLAWAQARVWCRTYKSINPNIN